MLTAASMAVLLGGLINLIGGLYVWRVIRCWRRLNGLLFYLCLEARCSAVAYAVAQRHPEASAIRIFAKAISDD